ncbi:hypothetical protein MMC20_003873 [Loxospora ochrophaea]|nr:hypothetical protein [Loxospora ochrophaea]
MVYYFTSDASTPPCSIYVGKDKFENEELINAHVYLRLDGEEAWDDIPKALVDDCVQLTKANSIEGNKKDNVTIIYTPWSNLKKDGSMAVGQVSFHDPRKTRRILVPTRLNPIVNRLTKTRTEIYPATDHLITIRESHLASLRKRKQEVAQARKKEETKLAKARREEKERRDKGYDDLFSEDALKESGIENQQGWDEDDFM